MSVSMSSMLPSSQRPVPLEGRIDLDVRRIEYLGTAYWVVKDPVGLRYHRLQAEQHRVLNLLDGARSLETIRDELRRDFPTIHFKLADVQRLITDLHDKGLLTSNRPGRGPLLLKQHQKHRRQKMLETLRNILYLRVPGWDPDRALVRLHPYLRWMFTPWAVAVAGVLVTASLVLLFVQFDEFRSRLPAFHQFFGWQNLVFLWFTLGATKVIHEFGHGMSCKHYGRECHEMGVMLLVFSPCLYCDVSDSWMLRSKWQRIVIGAAGMAIEVALSAVAIFVWWYTEPGLLNHLALNVFFISAVTTVVFNANPLMRYDGYYMLSDYLEIPNLRPKADRLLRDSFAWYCLGIEQQPDPFMPDRGKLWFILFAISAAIYRWIVLFGITLFLYTVLKPYGLQSIGAAMAIGSLVTVVCNMGWNVYRLVTAPRNDPMSRVKTSISLAFLGALVAAALFVPLPLHVEAPFTVEPRHGAHVYVSTPGRLIELKARPGDRVAKGDLLARLSNPEKQDEYHNFRVQADVQRVEVGLHRAVDDLGQQHLASQKLLSIERQLADYADQLEHLELRAPCAGTVVAPPRVEKPDVEALERRLNTWYGTPLEPRNNGCFLEEGTHLLTVAPDARLDAVLLVDQGDRNDMQVGRNVDLKVEHMAGRTFHAVIDTISQRYVEFAPRSLSNKLGGEISTVTDAQGHERLTSRAYQATVLLDDQTHLFTPGMRGKARFVAAKRSAGSWVWRNLRRTFHFRL